jgi:predicted Rossmann-fold nucleotide-binding protein
MMITGHARSAILCLGIAASLFAGAAMGCEPPSTLREATPEEIRAFFASKKRKVVTFLGYSGAGYEDEAAMLDQAARILGELDPKATIVNSGATAEGIGAVYRLAKERGFVTSGIVSTQARENKVPLSTCVDIVFFVEDETWGGFLPGTDALSPTSKAMVENSDVLIAIGGGEVARDELVAAKGWGKRVEFIPADMSHQIAREKAQKKGQPAPTDFRGAAATVF